MEPEEDQYGIENIAYDELEREFQSVLINLSSDQSLERFRVEYEKIHNALKFSHEQEKRLLSKCRQLSKDILAGATKVQSALKFSNDDSQTISYLKAELTKTHRFIELCREHEQLSRQKTDKRKEQMKKLQSILEQNDSATEGQVATVHEFKTRNEQHAKEKEILQVSVKANQDELSDVRAKIQEVEQKKAQLQQNLKQLLQRKAREEDKVRQEQDDKKKKKEQLQDIKVKFDAARLEEIDAKQKRKIMNINLKEKSAELHYYELNKEKQKKLEKKLIKQMDIEIKKIEEMDEIIQNLKRLEEEKATELHELEEQLLVEQEKQQKLAKAAAEINSAIDKLKIQKQKAEQLKETIQSGMNQLENEIGDEKKNALKDRSFIEKLKRDRDMYQKEIERAEANNKKIEQEILAKDKIQKQKENEIFGQKKEVQRLNKDIMTLQKETDAYAMQATTAQAKYFYSRDEVKLRDNFIAEFKKQNEQTQAKLKKQQSLYETVRSDRNLVAKNLAQIQKENKQYERRYNMVKHQISQQKEQIDTKEIELTREHHEHKKKDKKIEEEEKKIEKCVKDIQEREERVKGYHIEIKKLYAIIKQSQTQKQKLQEEYELVVAERDILGTQLIRRTAQADLLYEKIKINQSTLAKGQAQYKERLNEIQTKKEQITALINEIKNYKLQTNTIPDLKNEIHTLVRQNTDSKLKVKALSEELENRMNVHRWRKLEATDSLTYELMTKIQSIQKRLIAKTEQVSRKEKELKDKENELKQLEQILKRQPSVEQEKMIPIYELNLREKGKQMQSLLHDINNYRGTLEEYKIELQRLNKELDTFTKKYYYQKKREQQQKESANKQARDGTIQIHLPDKRFTGGGFNLAS